MSKYQALVNLSVPRGSDDKSGANDLVLQHDTVDLTDEVAAHFLGDCTCTPHRARRATPMIRKISEAKTPAPLILPKMMSGITRGAPAGARPDPDGSSRVIIQEVVPEDRAPDTDSEHTGTDLDPDAEDIPPRAARARAGAGAR